MVDNKNVTQGLPIKIGLFLEREGDPNRNRGVEDFLTAMGDTIPF